MTKTPFDYLTFKAKTISIKAMIREHRSVKDINSSLKGLNPIFIDYILDYAYSTIGR